MNKKAGEHYLLDDYMRLSYRSGDCRVWALGVNSGGYGPHKKVWQVVNGEIPAGMQIDHLCRRRNCINPAHLELVTPSMNARRSAAPEVTRQRFATQTHCKHGHEFTPENTAYRRITVQGYAGEKEMQRVCIQCRRAKERQYYWERKART